MRDAPLVKLSVPDNELLVRTEDEITKEIGRAVYDSRELSRQEKALVSEESIKQALERRRKLMSLIYSVVH